LIEARRLVLELGFEKFGPPTSATVATVEALDDLDLLHRLSRTVLRAANWQELLAVAADT
jgi:hypothetical protein